MKITRQELKDIILEETAALIQERPELLDEVSWLRRMARSVSTSDLAKKLRGNWDAASLDQMDDVDAVIRGEVSPFDKEGKRAASGAAKVVNGFVSRLNDVMLDFTDEMNFMLSSGDQNAFETFPGIKDNLTKIDNAITTAVTEAETALRELQSMMKGRAVSTSPEEGGYDTTKLTAQGDKRVTSPGGAAMMARGGSTPPLQARIPSGGSLEERIANEVAKLLGS